MAIVFKALEKSSALMILFAGLLLCGSSFAGGKAEKTQGGIILVLKGSHYEMGFQHGSLLAKEVKENIKAYLYDFAFDAAKHKREELRKIYETQEPFIPAYIKEEMKGLAEGSGASLEDVQLVHILPTIYHCSGAAVFGKAVKDKKLYHFRSLDYAINIGKEKKVQENAAVIVYQPDDGIAHAVVGWAGVLGAVSGMNAEGISIGEMGSSSKEDGFNGEPMWFVVRDALKNSRTLDDALNIMKKAKWDAGYNFIVADGKKLAAAAVEVTPSKVEVFPAGDKKGEIKPHVTIIDAIVRTNHFVSRELAKSQRDEYDPAKFEGGNSWQRFEAISAFIKKNHGKFDAALAMEIRTIYHPDYPCLHQALFSPSDLTFYVSNAKNPDKEKNAGAQHQKYYKYDLKTLMK